MNMKVLSFADGRVRKKLKGGEYLPDISWTGIVNRYFMNAFINERKDFNKFILDYGSVQELEKGFLTGERLANKRILQVGLCRDVLELKPGEEKTLELSIYSGLRKKEELLKAEGSLEAVNTQGWLGPVRAAIKAVLMFFYKVTRSYGIAIILLSCSLQLLMFPLSANSMKANKRMKELQPLMKDLQVKYKNDPKRLNAEVMELYKKKGVNPFSGCLPIIPQMPIFFALFTVLRESVELRYEGFFWVPDLTMMDPVYILPIMMGAAMFFQQKFTAPAGGDPAQAKMMLFMPVLFTFMFLKFPAGLVLYWLTSNILGLLQYAFYASKEKRNRVLAVP
jgi:YidC/Oxa1 family membrane protein insertase